MAGVALLAMAQQPVPRRGSEYDQQHIILYCNDIYPLAHAAWPRGEHTCDDGPAARRMTVALLLIADDAESANFTFLCLLPVRPVPPLSRGMKEHLQGHGEAGCWGQLGADTHAMD